MIDILKNHGLYANLKKYQFYKNKICFLGYIVLLLEVKIENELIKVVKN